MTKNRFFGPYAPLYWLLWVTNIVAAQFFWFRGIRTSIPWLFALSLTINIGMWLERFVIIPVSLHRDFLPSSWGMYYPTEWDWATFFGTIGFFLTLMFLFMRFLPAIAIFEMRTMVPPPASRPSPERVPEEPEVRA
jgi:molybdopterin-containing oxidoreductase family membrane subunit